MEPDCDTADIWSMCKKKGHRRNIITSLMIMFFSPRCWKTEPDCKTGNRSHLNIFLSHLIPLESTNPDRKTKYEAEQSQKPWKSDVSWAIWGFTLGSIPDRSSHALVSLLLNFMICIEFIHVLKCVRDQNMNNADPAGDLKRRHVTTIQRAWRCCNWNHWVNVCSPRTENTRPYGLSGYYNSPLEHHIKRYCD